MTSRLSRRTFLMMTAGSGTALMLEPGEQFLNKLIAYVNPPEYPQPGEWAFYSSICRECPAGCGMILWHRDGRITKAEGNPVHPVNRGKLCIRGQASVQGLYNTHRLSRVLRKEDGKLLETKWDEAFSQIKQGIASGKKVMVMSDLQTGSLAGIMNRFTGKFGVGPPLFYEALNYESLRQANWEVYGQPAIPRYDPEGCDLIISFGADFLATWLSPVEYAKDFGDMHTYRDQNIGRLIYAGPSETLTSLNADLFLNVSPENEAALIYQVIHILAANGKIDLSDVPIPAPQPGYENKYAQIIAGELIKAKSPLILAGSPEDASLLGKEKVKAATLLNELLGNSGRMDFSQQHALSHSALREETLQFLQSIDENTILFIHNTNPVYSIRDSEKYFRKASQIIYLGTVRNETCGMAGLILPVHYYLEDWGDYEPWKGTVSLMQPAMRPVFETKSAGDIFLELMSDAGTLSYKDFVRDNWKVWNQNNIPGDSDIFQNLLQQGFVATPVLPSHLQFKFSPAAEQPSAALQDNVFYLVTPASLFFYDGRLSNRPWLHEIPHPVSDIVWQSWIDMNAEKARKLNIDEGDMVEVSSGAAKLKIPVRLTNNISPTAVCLEMGQGHTSSGETASGVGVNAFELLSSVEFPENLLVKVEKAGKGEGLLFLHPTRDQHGRDLLKEVSPEGFSAAKEEEINRPTPEGYSQHRDLYPPHEHKEHRWGMVIDLQVCIGCKACEASCYAENNIPVVGRESCREGKEMSWLKVPAYHIKNNKTAFIPLPCQHCDAAPCEPVCPVFASVHTDEGLNAQIYNRCVGTRYCSNNCPYKVRRFNWKNIKYQYPWTLQLNPEVTVRSRGVMEKCTFCIQRIRNAEQQAKISGRTLQDGEIMTACQQTCPTGAIVFGDLMDKNSRVSKLMENNRRYQLLHELNTKPAVVYLKKINVQI